MKTFGVFAALISLVTTPQAAAGQGVAANSVEDARQVLDTYGRCAAGLFPGEAARILELDFTSSRYRTALGMLARDAEDRCAPKAFRSGRLRMSLLPFAGALAEGLLRPSDEPLNIRLAKASGEHSRTFSSSDRVAQCLARSLPDQVSALFATKPGTPAEAEALVPLDRSVALCADAAGLKEKIEISPAGLRAMIATAAFRLVTASEDRK